MSSYINILDCEIEVAFSKEALFDVIYEVAPLHLLKKKELSGHDIATLLHIMMADQGYFFDYQEVERALMEKGAAFYRAYILEAFAERGLIKQ
jgi:hypothetical protein